MTSIGIRSLVTGGSGFLGSHVCDRLLAEGHEVFCLDNLITGRKSNIQHILDHPRFTFIEQDITQPLHTLNFVSNENRFDFVLHLACPASPKDYLRYPIQTLLAGSAGTRNALELATSCQAVFLISSSSEVYGDPEVNPQPESYWGSVNPIGPRSVYDEAKRFGEAISMAYHREHGTKVRIARIFNTYGERMRIEDGRVLPNFMMQSMQGKPLTVYGDGTQTRSLCYVDDLVEGLYRLMLSDMAVPVNIGNPEEVTVLQLAKEIIDVTDSKSAIIYEPLPTDDPRRRRPDISRAVAVLNWKPQISRMEGLRRVIPYFRSQVKALCAQ